MAGHGRSGRDAGLNPKTDHDEFSSWASGTGLPLDDTQIEALREGYALMQQLRAKLHRPAALDADLAVVFAPEFDSWSR